MLQAKCVAKAGYLLSSIDIKSMAKEYKNPHYLLVTCSTRITYYKDYRFHSIIPLRIIITAIDARSKLAICDAARRPCSRRSLATRLA